MISFSTTTFASYSLISTPVDLKLHGVRHFVDLGQKVAPHQFACRDTSPSSCHPFRMDDRMCACLVCAMSLFSPEYFCRAPFSICPSRTNVVVQICFKLNRRSAAKNWNLPSFDVSRSLLEPWFTFSTTGTHCAYRRLAHTSKVHLMSHNSASYLVSHSV